ncbi:MAG: YARHG domain-containing protein [Firmicutes bacterium]|nr:YARHG domain-containing protein [Bacillota bacterium]
MKCQNCGTELNDDMRFCSNCGKPVISVQKPEPTPDNPVPQKGTERSAKKFQRTALIVIAAVVLLSITVCTLYYFVQKAKLLRAEQAMQDNDYDLALELYDSISGISPDKTTAQNMSKKLVQAKAAVRDASKALENGDESEFNTKISKAYSCIKDYYPAKELEHTAVMSKEIVDAETYYNSGEYAKALDISQRLSNDEASNEIAETIKERANNIVSGIGSYEQAAARNVRAAISAGDIAQAESISKQVSERLPDSDTAKTLSAEIRDLNSAISLIQSAQAEKNSGNWSKALSDLESAFKLCPDYEDKYSQLYNDVKNGKLNAENLQKQQLSSSSEYVMPDSSSRYLTREELSSLSSAQLRIARNEIYARHGRRFKDAGLQAHFDSCSWYRGTISPDNFNSGVLNNYENANKDLILQIEKERG